MKTTNAAVRAKSTSVVRNLIARSGPPLPPHRGTDQCRHQRYQDQNNPAQITERGLIEAEGKCFRHLRRDTDHLLATHQPVNGARNKIEGLLILSERIVLNKKRIAHYHHTGRIHPHPFVATTALFDRDCDGQWRSVVPILVEL